LVKKERNLVSYRDNLMQELSADESKLYNDVYDRIQTYLNSYAEENNLEMILSYTRGGGVWYAKGNLDVTNSVIEGINSQYNATKATAQKK
jgi:outer membrane protein